MTVLMRRASVGGLFGFDEGVDFFLDAVAHDAEVIIVAFGIGEAAEVGEIHFVDEGFVVVAEEIVEGNAGAEFERGKLGLRGDAEEVVGGEGD